MRDEAELRAFTERAIGAPLARFERVGSGASRATWRADPQPSGMASVVLRCDSPDGPLSGTELDLAREAAVYRALDGTRVRIPRLIAELGDGEALLVECVAGSEDVRALGPPERTALARDFMRALAELHTLDPATLALPGFARPIASGEHARFELALWRRIHDARTEGGDELLDFALAWLDEHAPESGARTSLCHGDAGAGNFLFEAGRVTALLDWEFAHVGDPLDDLAWVAVRAQLVQGFGDLADAFDCWSIETGLVAVRETIEYFRALVLVRMAIACRVALAHTGARAMDQSVYELLLPYLRTLLPEALGRAGAKNAPAPATASPLVAVLGALEPLP